MNKKFWFWKNNYLYFVEKIAYNSWYDDIMSFKLFCYELNKHKGDIVVVINSFGGDFYAGVLIYYTLKSYNGKVIVKIIGWAGSAASLIAMSGDIVEISSVGKIFVHNPIFEFHNVVEENIISMDDVIDNIVEIYKYKSHLSEEKIKQFMNNETCFNANESVCFGFADKIIGW